MMTYRMVRTHPTREEQPLVFGSPDDSRRLPERMALFATTLTNSQRLVRRSQVATRRGLAASA